MGMLWRKGCTKCWCKGCPGGWCKVCTGTRVQGGGEQHTLRATALCTCEALHTGYSQVGGGWSCSRPLAHARARPPCSRCPALEHAGKPGVTPTPAALPGHDGTQAARQGPRALPGHHGTRGTLGHGLSRRPARAPGPTPMARGRRGAQDLARGLVGLGGCARECASSCTCQTMHRSVSVHGCARPHVCEDGAQV